MIDPTDDLALEEWFAEVLEWDATAVGAHKPYRTVAYGPHTEQVADLWLPDDPIDARVVVSIHGGAFMAEFDRHLHQPVVRELARRGFAVWNVEYRRAGTGRLAETTEDVWQALDCLVALPGLRNQRVAVFGHSAGGYLTEWVARHRAVELAIPLAAVTDLPTFVASGRDDGGVSQWLGSSPIDDPAVYKAADVRRRLPAGTRHVLIHGDVDTTVDIQQSRDHVIAVRASGDPFELIELPREGHYAFLDPRQPAVQVLCEALEKWRSST